MAASILLLEDEDATRFLIKTTLEGVGFEVSQCLTLAAAKAAFTARRPDLCLLDLGLPDGDSLELVRAWTAHEGPPILVLTARQDIMTRLDVFKAGAHDYIQKPFSIEELLARVQVHLQLKQTKDDLELKSRELQALKREVARLRRPKKPQTR